jgi:hypothetical protein
MGLAHPRRVELYHAITGTGTESAATRVDEEIATIVMCRNADANLV